MDFRVRESDILTGIFKSVILINGGDLAISRMG